MYIDVETTGLEKLVHGLVEMAFIIEIDGEVIESGEMLINAFTYSRPCGSKVSPKALEVNGRSIEEIQGFPNSKDQCKGFVAIINKYIDRWDKNDKFKFIGYNVQFDAGFIQEWFKDSGYDNYGQYFCYKTVDPFELIKYLVHLEYLDTGKSQSLVAVSEYFGIELDAHKAMSDIYATREIHQLLISKVFREGLKL